ncbi:MAG: phosphate ABC transporter permease PstA [Pirellulaceae bacterium]|nr:phosphate ABC transporter permease PstA [Pirellulaceae bacterium]
MELATWKEQFTDEPPAIQSAIDRFAMKWQEVLEQKGPLEDQIRQAEASSAGNELSVIVPSDAITLELAKADSDQLLKGQWTEAAQAVLAQQSILPQPDTLNVQPLGDHITLVEFVDANLGRLTLWCVQRSDAPAVWLMPPQRAVNCSEIVRLFPANRLSTLDKFAVYFSRWHEFLLDEPREANTEGGVFPAIWGTVVMTLIMTLAVVPFGVIAALYLREYTRSGPLVSLVRISINNLAGVPSIVYGVFGLAFFCYSIGAFIDGGAKNAQFGSLPSNGWYGLLAGTIGAGVLAFMASLLSSGADQSPSEFRRRLASIAPAIWFASLIGAAVLIFKSPFFNGFYEARLPAPTFGKEGLLWASFTLALLTLPVVIVATEEALSAVPNSLREGSLACGASKWQTIYHIVLPHARPGILTGAILAMARGIGEVAPLMLVGALPVAPDLPLDGEFPYFHGSRSFMHLGYQIYWLGFQSQNSEASKPLVFTCTLLLILIVISLNLSAILLRARLRRRFQGNQF